MPTFSSDVKPANTGQALGNTIQKWIGYFSNAFIDTLLSSAANAAQTGFLRLASGDFIGWRNAANSADLKLAKTTVASTTTPVDTLYWNGSGIEGPFISSSANPASAGQLRLASTDLVNFRNNANTGDVPGLTHNSDDTVTVGGSSGLTQTAGTFTTLSVSTTLTSINLVGSSAGDLAINAAAAKNLTILAGTDSTQGGSVTIGGGTGSSSGNAGSVTIHAGQKLGAGSAGNLNLGDANGPVNLGRVGGTLNLLGTVNQYNSIATAGQGVVPVHAITSQKSESAADTNVLTFTPPAVVGSYRIRFTMAVSAQNTATLGWTATWTDSNAHAQAPTNLALTVAGTAAPALTFVAVTNGIYYGYIDIDTDNSATAIVVKLTFTGTSFSAKVTATVERIV